MSVAQAPALSVIIPIACTAPHLVTVVTRLLRTNACVFRAAGAEIVLVDCPNPENRAVLPSIEETARDCGARVDYVETDLTGVNAKIEAGVARASGRYLTFLTDECVSMYDFFDDALRIATDGMVCSIPYLEAQLPDDGSFPLRYSRTAPVMPVTFLLAGRDMFLEITSGLPPQSYLTWHVALAVWSAGVLPVFASRHLRYCPVVKMDAAKPPIYQPIAPGLWEAGRNHFMRSWPPERREETHRKMRAACERIVAERGASLCVVGGPAGGVFIVSRGNGEPVPPGYDLLESPSRVREECDRAFEQWRTTGFRGWRSNGEGASRSSGFRPRRIARRLLGRRP